MKESITPELASLYVYMTQGCNLRCQHCWIVGNGRGKVSELPVLDIELFEKILEQAKPMGLRSVKLTGGEPMAHPHIELFLDLINTRHFRLIVETNGTLITPEIAKKMALQDSTHVSVSLDGNIAETHDRIRGVKGAFKQALQGIQYLREVNIRPQVIMTLMRENSDQIESLVERCEGLGVESVKFNIMTPVLGGEKLHQQQKNLSILEILRLHRQVIKRLESNTSVKLITSLPYAFRGLHQVSGCSGKQGVCGVRNILGVLATGHYALCGIGENVPELVFGHASQDPLSNVWQQHPILQQIRDDLPQQFEGVCGQCLHKSTCFGSCIAQNYYSHHNLTSGYWFCQTALQEGLFPRQRLMNPQIEVA